MGKLWKIVRNGESWLAAVHGVPNRNDLATKQNVTSLVIIHLKTERLYLFDWLHPVFPIPNPTCGNHRNDLFVYEFVYFWNLIYLGHYVTKNSDMIFLYISKWSPWSLVTVCCSIIILHSYCLYSPHCTFHVFDIYVTTGSLYHLLNLPHIFFFFFFFFSSQLSTCLLCVPITLFIFGIFVYLFDIYI